MFLLSPLSFPPLQFLLTSTVTSASKLVCPVLKTNKQKPHWVYSLLPVWMVPYGTIYWSMYSLSGPTSLKKNDSAFPSNHQLPVASLPRDKISWETSTSTLGFWPAWSSGSLVHSIPTTVSSCVQLCYHACKYCAHFSFWLVQSFHIFCYENPSLVGKMYNINVPFRAEQTSFLFSICWLFLCFHINHHLL